MIRNVFLDLEVAFVAVVLTFLIIFRSVDFDTKVSVSRNFFSTASFMHDEIREAFRSLLGIPDETFREKDIVVRIHKD